VLSNEPKMIIVCCPCVHFFLYSYSLSLCLLLILKLQTSNQLTSLYSL